MECLCNVCVREIRQKTSPVIDDISLMLQAYQLYSLLIYIVH